MNEKNSTDPKTRSAGDDSVSIIYHQRSDSPKYFEIKKSKIFVLLIGLPTITLISLVLGGIGLIHTSPFHLIESVKETSAAQKIAQEQQALREENEELKSELEQARLAAEQMTVTKDNTATATEGEGPDARCPAPVACAAPNSPAVASSIGLSTLSFFRPIQGQKDRTRPAQMNLSGFKTVVGRDNVNLQFNIIPATGTDNKISGHIVVLMKSDQGIQVYPAASLAGADHQINYAAGEPFATQRFRPVDAPFLKPRRGGNFIFTIFIFSRTGDLIHYQNANMVIKI